ncbi:hypothetical protein Ae201684P_003633 [Aphanomyces euteiches]|nr:hypothetical protein Ae201684P_003633 [Aphanomyces euteiches]
MSPSSTDTTDGGCRNNGSESSCGGAGSALFAPDGTVIYSLQHWLPDAATNNVAEYTALLNDILSVLHWRLPALAVECDSQLVLSQVSGNARVALPQHPHFRNRVLKALKVLRAKGRVTTLRHIPRNANTVADGLANSAMDTRETTFACFCKAPSIQCVPKDLAQLLHSAPQPISSLSGMSRPSTLRAIARARLRSPAAARCATDSPALLASGPAPSGASAGHPRTTALPSPSPQPCSALPAASASSLPSRIDVPSGSESTTLSCGVALHASCSEQPTLAEPPPSAALVAAETLLNALLDVADPPSSPEPPPFSHPSFCATTRQPRLSLPPTLPEATANALAAALKRLVASMVVCLDDSSSWDEVEPLLNSLPYALTQCLAKFLPSNPSGATSSRSASASPVPRPHRPSPVPETQLAHRIEEAMASLSANQSSSSASQRSVFRARRKLGRLQKAFEHVRLRRLFVTNEKKCVEGIFRQASGTPLKSSKCTIPLEALADHFRSCNRPQRFDVHRASGSRFLELLDGLPPAEYNAQVFSDDITMGEIEDVLNKANLMSAPGLDGVPYRIYFRFRLLLLPLLYTVFNRCWSAKRVPSAWKLSVTELIFKKGDPNSVSNWRPLALQSTIYKLYASILKSRLSLWLESNERLSNSQKGFRQFNGCHEHNFVAQAMLDTTRRSKSPFFAVWYDLRNAFGTMPHDFLWLVLSKLGVPSAFVDLVRDIYTGASTIVTTPLGACPPIDQLCGVFQGCPLSPLLFIAGLVPLMDALDAQAATHGVQLAPSLHLASTAFADDVKVFSRSASGIRALHQTVVDFLDWSTMTANPAKCAFLGVTYEGSKLAPSDIVLSVDGVPLPTLSLLDSYTYLGIREGFDHEHVRFQLDAKLHPLRQQITALVQSALAPWQIIKAIKVYVLSQLDYAIRHVKAPLSQLKSFSSFLTKSLRHLLRLPATATNEFFFSPPTCGGLGILPLDELRAASLVTHAFQMLTSPDNCIQQLAREQLRAIIHKRFSVDSAALLEAGDLALQRFLNGTLHEQSFVCLKRQHADISSMWTEVQAALHRFRIRFRSHGSDHFDIRLPHMTKSLTPEKAARELKTHIKLAHVTRWGELKDQGRTTLLHGREGSKFLLSGGKLWDSNYRFGISARLNQPLHETLAHVLQRCPHNEVAIRKRHDAALKTIAHAVLDARPECILRVNSSVPGFDGDVLKPDIQLLDEVKKTVVICDLALAYEDDQLHDGNTVFERVAKDKISKYSPLSRHLTRQGYEVYTCALAYGSLGSVAPANQNILMHVLGLSRQAASKLQCDLSSSIIKASRSIWLSHCSGPPPAAPAARPGWPEALPNSLGVVSGALGASVLSPAPFGGLPSSSPAPLGGLPPSPPSGGPLRPFPSAASSVVLSAPSASARHSQGQRWPEAMPNFLGTAFGHQIDSRLPSAAAADPPAPSMACCLSPGGSFAAASANSKIKAWPEDMPNFLGTASGPIYEASPSQDLSRLEATAYPLGGMMTEGPACADAGGGLAGANVGPTTGLNTPHSLSCPVVKSLARPLGPESLACQDTGGDSCRQPNTLNLSESHSSTGIHDTESVIATGLGVRAASTGIHGVNDTIATGVMASSSTTSTALFSASSPRLSRPTTRQTRRFIAPSTSPSPSRTALPVASTTEPTTPRVASATPLLLLPLAAPTPGAHSQQATLPPSCHHPPAAFARHFVTSRSMSS